jgi:predicted NAD/FAD-binding protein
VASGDIRQHGFIIAHCGNGFHRDGADKPVSITQGWKKPLRREPTCI